MSVNGPHFPRSALDAPIAAASAAHASIPRRPKRRCFILLSRILAFQQNIRDPEGRERQRDDPVGGKESGVDPRKIARFDDRVLVEEGRGGRGESEGEW